MEPVPDYCHLPDSLLLTDKARDVMAPASDRPDRLLLTDKAWACMPPMSDDSGFDGPELLPYNKPSKRSKGSDSESFKKRHLGAKTDKRGGKGSDSESSKRRRRGAKTGKRARARAISVSSSSSSSSSDSDVEIVRAPEPRKGPKLCTNCNEPGHTCRNCPKNPVCTDPECHCVQCPEKAKVRAKVASKRRKAALAAFHKEQKASRAQYVLELQQMAEKALAKKKARDAKKALKRAMSSCKTDSSSDDSDSEADTERAHQKPAHKKHARSSNA
jgi:hypothetical protein